MYIDICVITSAPGKQRAGAPSGGKYDHIALLVFVGASWG